MKAEDLKLIVQDKYATIARQSKDQDKHSCCCNKDGDDDMDYSVFSDDYTSLEGTSITLVGKKVNGKR